MEETQKILLIEFCNFKDYPIGGLLTFSRSLMASFKSELSLVGITTSKTDPIGKWFKKKIDGIEYNYFALARYDTSRTKNLIPDRLSTFLFLRYYKKRILKIDINNVFVQRQDILIAIKNINFKNVCFRFAGLENPLQFSKYWYGHFIADYFDKLTFRCLKNVKTILATGDETAIDEMVKRSKFQLTKGDIIQFPTRINTEIFKRRSKDEVRKTLNYSDSTTIISTTGRLCQGKGWKFLIDCFYEFQKKDSDSLFIFIGEGEDFKKIQDYIAKRGLNEVIKILGKKSPQEISLFLNASDLYVMGSYKEGWSTTLMEALACGVPICTTNFSSAKSIVKQNISGYIVEDRDVFNFCESMEQSLKLDRSKLPIDSEIDKYSLSSLKSDLLKNWKLI
jgi:glycosyltransferase involved in cell wall biosynthesis